MKATGSPREVADRLNLSERNHQTDGFTGSGSGESNIFFDRGIQSYILTEFFLKVYLWKNKSMPFPSDRSLLRQKARSIRSELDPDIHEASSLKIAGHILNHPKLKTGQLCNSCTCHTTRRSAPGFTTRELINRGTQTYVFP